MEFQRHGTSLSLLLLQTGEVGPDVVYASHILRVSLWSLRMSLCEVSRMSSRTRIMLIVPGQKYMEARCGNAAVEHLRSLYEASFETIIANYQTVGNVEVPMFKTTHLPPAPKHLPKWRLARWYWDHMSSGYRQNATFVITRESRRFNWGKSPANPTLAGAVVPRKFKKKPVKPGALYFSPSSWKGDTWAQLKDEVIEYPIEGSIPKKKRNDEHPPEKKLRVGIWS
jgi:hypothetical protein